MIRNRLESFINGKYGLDEKIAAFINKVIHLIPDQIDIGDTGLYLDGFLFDNIQAKNKLLKIPLKTQIRYDNATYDSDGCGLPLYLQL